MPDRSSAGGGVVIVDAGGCCAVVAVVAADASGVAAVVMGVLIDTIDGVVDGGGSTASATTLLASTVPVGAASAAGADAGTDVLVSLPEAGFDAARNRVGCRRAAFVGRVFESVAEWVGAGTSVPDVSCAARVLGGGVADCEDGVDSRSCGAVVAASAGVLERLRAPPVLTIPPGLADRVAGADASGEEVAWLIGGRVDVWVDGEDAVELGDDEDFPVAELDAESDDEDEPESDGLAEATPGDAASPTPMPKATPNAPTRPIRLA